MKCWCKIKQKEPWQRIENPQTHLLKAEVALQVNRGNTGELVVHMRKNRLEPHFP